MQRVLALAALSVTSLFAQNAQEIVQRSVDRFQANTERLRDYAFVQRSEEITYNKQGEVTKRDSETHEVLILAGRPYERLVAKNGEPLSEKETQKEQEKVDKELAKRLKDPEKQRKELEKDREESRRYLSEIPRAFDFTLLGEDTVDGLPVWKIQAEPRPDFKANEGNAKNFKKVRGTLWIEQASYQWVKMDLEVVDTISWGWFVLRIPPGAKMAFQQTRLNDETWVPSVVNVRANAKLGLMKTFRMGFDMAYSDYRKFSAESQVVGVEEVQQ